MKSKKTNAEPLSEAKTEAYDKEYFIKKFSAIPEEEIGEGLLHKHCALWHCGVKTMNNGDYTKTKEAKALAKILNQYTGYPVTDNTWCRSVYEINDGIVKSLGKTPKERILNILNRL